jgi:hypothetical protein
MIKQLILRVKQYYPLGSKNGNNRTSFQFISIKPIDNNMDSLNSRLIFNYFLFNRIIDE